ncbi:MAG: ADP-glyceromanno-heptose 6-epimerase [Gammaproteobacteria bacterium]|nr:ADP-glyceromanno-heptose 6-epimerase [Gammaproteobacteria bacterium]
MIIVTGGAGFIGSNLVHALNAAGRSDILIVDDLEDGRKFANLATARIADYQDRTEFRQHLQRQSAWLKQAEVIYHLGACATTTEWNGRYMLDNNHAYSRDVLDACEFHGVPLVYASSAAVYGDSALCVEEASRERPLNVYGYSKLVFDQHLRQRMASLRIPVTGLRYFNVYGPREQHKGRMASVIFHFDQQLRESGKVRLFEGSHGMAAGEQLRDFVHVDDVVAMTLWAGTLTDFRGVLNCGTGEAVSFNAVARALIEWHGRGEIEYIPFPEDLRAAYQAHTRADLTAARSAGYDASFRKVEQGVRDYLDWLHR